MHYGEEKDRCVGHGDARDNQEKRKEYDGIWSNDELIGIQDDYFTIFSAP